MSPLVVLLLVGMGPQQAPSSGYVPSTLGGAIAEHGPLLEGMRAGDDLLVPGSDRYRANVRYLGRTREIPEARERFLRKWMASFGKSPTFDELFEREILVAEGSDEHWLPIQRLLLPAFEREVERGDAVALYVVFVGGRVPDWIFLVDAFAVMEHGDHGT